MQLSNDYTDQKSQLRTISPSMRLCFMYIVAHEQPSNSLVT